MSTLLSNRTHLATAALLALSGVSSATAALVPWGSPQALSPAQARVERALEAIADGPSDARHYSALAFALARRGRETADPLYYERALAATDVALSLEPGAFEARKQRTWALLGLHRFAEAAEEAQALHQRVPDDLTAHGLLVDAYVELGRYEEAVEVCQRLLDRRPGNVPGLTRAAYLRELHGDVDGALELMLAALRRVPEDEREDRAWVLTHVGHLYRLEGRFAEAEQALDGALLAFPDYHYALAQLAHVRAAQGDREGAQELFARRYNIAPHPENLFDLAEAAAARGAQEEARELFAQFEKAGLAESTSEDNANYELVRYFVDHARRPAEALRVAKLELERRSDVRTLDGYAWALLASGATTEAAAVGVRLGERGTADPVVLYHLGAIAAASGETERAAVLLRDALARDGGSTTAERARELLREITQAGN